MNKTPEQFKKAMTEYLKKKHEVFCKEEDCEKCQEFEKLLVKYK